MTREEYVARRERIAKYVYTVDGLVPSGEAMIVGALVLIADCLRDLVEKK